MRNHIYRILLFQLFLFFFTSCFYKPDYEKEYKLEKNSIQLSPKFHKKLEISWKPKRYSPFYVVRKEIGASEFYYQDSTTFCNYVDTTFYPNDSCKYEIYNSNGDIEFCSTFPSMNCNKNEWYVNYKIINKDTCLLIFDKPQMCTTSHYVISTNGLDLLDIDRNEILIPISDINNRQLFDYYAYYEDDLVKFRKDSLRLFETPKVERKFDIYFINKYNKRIFAVDPDKKNEVIQYKISNNEIFDISPITRLTVSEKKEIAKLLYVSESNTFFYLEKDDSIKAYCFYNGDRIHFRSKCDPIIACTDSLFAFIENDEIKIMNYKDALNSNIQRPATILEGYNYIDSYKNKLLVAKNGKTYTYNIDSKEYELEEQYELEKAIFVNESISYLNESTIKLPNNKETSASFSSVNLLRYSPSNDFLYVFLNDRDIDVIDMKEGTEICSIHDCLIYNKDSLHDIITFEDKIIFLYPNKFIIAPALK